MCCSHILCQTTSSSAKLRHLRLTCADLHSDVVSALIKGKHDVNFPSSRPEHEGRTPLQELAYRCRGADRLQEIEETIWALEKGKVDALKCRSKEDWDEYVLRDLRRALGERQERRSGEEANGSGSGSEQGQIGRGEEIERAEQAT